MNIIELKDLTYSYPATEKPVLDHISLQIEKGDFLAIVGNNGCGKSTLCKTLNGLIPHFISGNFRGQVVVDGVDTLQSDVGNLACKAGYVYQDFENQIVRPTVLDDASYACLNYAMDHYLERGKEALEMCGLSGREDDYIWQLSGGQTHLLALAGAVSLRPEVLILDEPIAQLDPGHADRIYQVLRELNEKYNKTIIVIEHHTEYIADYCKHVVLMKDGKIAWKLPVKEALRRVEELRECNIFPPQVTVAADRLQKQGLIRPDAALPTTIEEGLRLFEASENKASENKTRKEDTGETAQAKTYTSVGSNEAAGSERTTEKAGEALDFSHVQVSYRSVKGENRRVFDDLNIRISHGEKIALIGSNGAGKSTLMKMMVGLLKPDAGEIFLEGETLSGKRPEQLSRHISLVYQNPEDMFIKDSIEADIAYAMQVRNVADYRERTEALLERFSLTGLRDRDGRLMSGGQMRRASLAIGVALNPRILLLDEPTANLDIATRKEIMKTLSDMKEITDTVIIATHDMQLVCEWADRIIVLCGGNVIADGSPDEIFSNQKVMDHVGIRPPEIFTLARRLDKNAFCYTIDDFVRTIGEERAWN